MTTLTRYVLRFSFASLLVSYRPLARKGQPKPILRNAGTTDQWRSAYHRSRAFDALLC